MFKDIDPWYTKFTWAREFTVVGHGASDEALLQANDTIRHMFAYRHDVLKALISDGVKLVVLAPDETVSDLPEYQRAKGTPRVEPNARFLTYSPDLKLLVVPQEGVLCSSATATDEGSPVIRVFADALYRVVGLRPADPDFRGNQQYELRVKRLDVEFDQAVDLLFDKAQAAGKWEDTLASSDKFEYWVAGVLAYFDAQGNNVKPADATAPVDTRERLRAYDPDLFELVHQTMAYEDRVDWRYVAVSSD
jgi:hypothetical protein